MTTTSEQDENLDEGQPLVDHLIELRSRVLRSLVAVFIIFLPLFYFANDIYGFVSEPLRAFLPEGATMIATEVASPLMTDINRYLDFVLKLFFAFGIAFEIPIATILLVWTGATDIESLRRKRAYVVVGCFVVGMLLTPPDIISQILLALPMWLLYEIGILFSIFLVRPESDTDAS